jgi:hypothetical protein
MREYIQRQEEEDRQLDHLNLSWLSESGPRGVMPRLRPRIAVLSDSYHKAPGFAV